MHLLNFTSIQTTTAAVGCHGYTLDYAACYRAATVAASLWIILQGTYIAFQERDFWVFCQSKLRLTNAATETVSVSGEYLMLPVTERVFASIKPRLASFDLSLPRTELTYCRVAPTPVTCFRKSGIKIGRKFSLSLSDLSSPRFWASFSLCLSSIRFVFFTFFFLLFLYVLSFFPRFVFPVSLPN